MFKLWTLRKRFSRNSTSVVPNAMQVLLTTPLLLGHNEERLLQRCKSWDRKGRVDRYWVWLGYAFLAWRSLRFFENKHLPDFSQMRRKGSRFTLGGWGLRVYSLDVAQPFATVRTCSQPSATARSPLGSSCVAGAALQTCRIACFLRTALSGLRQVVTTCKFCGRRGILWHAMKLDGSLARNIDFSPHLCVGFLFLILYPTASASSSATLLSHSHNFVTHHLTHTTLSRTIFHTPSHSHNFVTRHLSHTISLTQLCHTTLSHNFLTHHLSHTISLTQLCHTPSFTHHLTHTTLSHTIFHTPSFTHHLTHTALSHAIFHTPSHSHNFVTQLWHWVTSTFVLRDRRGTCRGTWRHRPSLRVAGMALGDIDLRFAWQAWRWMTSTFFAWQAWRLRHWAGFGGALWCALGSAWTPVTPQYFAWQAWHLVTSTFASRGRRGPWRHRPSLRVAGVALGVIYLVLRGRRGIGWLGDIYLRFGVALVNIDLGFSWRAWHLVLGDIDLRFAWQAWHLRHWAGFGGELRRALGRGRDAAVFCVASAALGDIHPRFAWWHPPRFCVAGLHRPSLSRGRRGTWWHRPSFCVAGVAFAAPGWLWWRACAHGWARLVAGGAAVLCVAGVALGDIHLGFAWQAWRWSTSTLASPGRRGT